MTHVAVAGGGGMGAAAALELRRRGHRVTLVDPGPLPHPDASSTDTSKAVRMDYGDDAFYVDLAAEALEAWRRLDREWGCELFHETGILLLAARSLDGPCFEGASFRSLEGRGLPLERLSGAQLGQRFEAWRDAPYPDAYFNRFAGWVESARAVEAWLARARAAGVEIRERTAAVDVATHEARAVGLHLAGGDTLRADAIVVAAGAWTPTLLPRLADRMQAVGQPVVYFSPTDPSRYDGRRFPVWCANIAESGWYGFPVTAAGELKVGRHGPGRPFRPGDPQRVEAEDVSSAVAFVRRTLPALSEAPVSRTRLCLYCDTFDGDFLVDRDPECEGLVVAAGGSGHAFKFVPLIGRMIADLVEGRDEASPPRWRWRAAGPSGREAARSAR